MKKLIGLIFSVGAITVMLGSLTGCLETKKTPPVVEKKEDKKEAAVLGASLMPGGPVAAQAKAEPDLAPYAKEAMDNLTGSLKKAKEDGYAMKPAATTIFGGWLPRGQKKQDGWVKMITLNNLDPKKQYRIIASGDNDTEDLDLRIVDPAGEVVDKDTTTSRNAEVTFRPVRQQDYVIELRLYESKDNSVCLGAVLWK